MGERRGPRDAGSMAVEVVVLVPVLLLVMLLVVAMGRYVSAQGAVAAAARDAVRTATLERDPQSALDAARATARDVVPDTVVCAPAVLDGAFVAGATVSVRLDCRVSWDSLGLIGLTGTAEVCATSSAPIDLYRRTSP